MNVTLSLPEDLVEEARRGAKGHGQGLNGLLRSELERLTGRSDRQAALEELERLWKTGGGRSKGGRWSREEIYDRAVLRRHQRPRLRGRRRLGRHARGCAQADPGGLRERQLRALPPGAEGVLRRRYAQARHPGGSGASPGGDLIDLRRRG